MTLSGPASLVYIIDVYSDKVILFFLYSFHFLKSPDGIFRAEPCGLFILNRLPNFFDQQSLFTDTSCPCFV